jgi:hypothetical protein
MMLSDDAVVSLLKRAILSSLGVSPADYRVDVALDVGDTFVTVQDVRGGVDTCGPVALGLCTTRRSSKRRREPRSRSGRT